MTYNGLPVHSVPITTNVVSSNRAHGEVYSICDKVCQWLMAGRWFDTATLVSFTNKTVRPEITEILSKVALTHNTVTVSILTSRDHSQLKLVYCLIIYHINWNIHGIFWFLTRLWSTYFVRAWLMYIFAVVSNTYCVVFFCVFLRFVYPMLPVSLGYSFLIALSVLSNDYFRKHTRTVFIKNWFSLPFYLALNPYLIYFSSHKMGDLGQ